MSTTLHFLFERLLPETCLNLMACFGFKKVALSKHLQHHQAQFSNIKKPQSCSEQQVCKELLSLLLKHTLSPKAFSVSAGFMATLLSSSMDACSMSDSHLKSCRRWLNAGYLVCEKARYMAGVIQGRTCPLNPFQQSVHNFIIFLVCIKLYY